MYAPNRFGGGDSLKAYERVIEGEGVVNSSSNYYFPLLVMRVFLPV